MGECLAHGVIQNQLQKPGLEVVAGDSDLFVFAPVPRAVPVFQRDVAHELRKCECGVVSYVQSVVVAFAEDIRDEL